MDHAVVTTRAPAPGGARFRCFLELARREGLRPTLSGKGAAPTGPGVVKALETLRIVRREPSEA